MKHILLLLGLFVLMLGCDVKKPISENSVDPFKPALGNWLFSLDLGEGDQLEFEFKLSGLTSGMVINGDERIEVKEITYRGDSIFIALPMFNSEFKGRVRSKDRIDGVWCNYAKRKDYTIPFTAWQSNEARYASNNKSHHRLDKSQKWEVHFSPDAEGGGYDAVGMFESKGNRVSGTFMTETGDYRYLAGSLCGDTLVLSCFDGSHAFFFKGLLGENTIDQAYFKSGVHWKEPWQAKINPSFELRDPYELTYIKDGYDGIAFEFPDLDGKMVRFPNERFDNKVTILQIMGSWCPNCMDETRLLAEIEKKYNENDLEIVALCFERPKEFEDAVKNIRRLKSHLGAEYTFLHAGISSKNVAAEKLPMLNKIMSFPTTIFIDKKGEIRKIHTGFYGPGTGAHYDRTVAEFYNLIDELKGE